MICRMIRAKWRLAGMGVGQGIDKSVGRVSAKGARRAGPAEGIA